MSKTVIIRIAIIAVAGAMVAVAQSGLVPGFDVLLQAGAAFLGGFVLPAPKAGK